MNVLQQKAWNRLLTSLTEAKSVFHQFMLLLVQEEQALQKMDRAVLADINHQKEQVLDGMCRLDQQVTRELHLLSGLEGKESNWRWLKEQSGSNARLAHGLWSDLRQLAVRIQEQGQTNQALIRRIHHKVSEGIHFLYTGLGMGPVYQGTGTVHHPPVPGSVHLQG